MKISTTLWTKPTSCRIIDAKGTVIGMIRVLGAAKSPLLSECVLHAHDCWEVILNLSGEGMETVDGEEAPFYAGSVTVCPPFAPHNKRCEAGAQEFMLTLVLPVPEQADAENLTHRIPSSP